MKVNDTVYVIGQFPNTPMPVIVEAKLVVMNGDEVTLAVQHDGEEHQFDTRYEAISAEPQDIVDKFIDTEMENLKSLRDSLTDIANHIKSK